jgi:hypothetical protein
VASEVAYHILGGNKNGWKPMVLKINDINHWFIKNDEYILDITDKQFKEKLDYSKARGIGFLTKYPSKRSIILLKRIEDKSTGKLKQRIKKILYSKT